MTIAITLAKKRTNGYKIYAEEYADKPYFYPCYRIVVAKDGDCHALHTHECAKTTWRKVFNRTVAEYRHPHPLGEYVCQLDEDEQRIVRRVVTNYVKKYLPELTADEQKEMIENAMDERLYNITDAEYIYERLAENGII